MKALKFQHKAALILISISVASCASNRSANSMDGVAASITSLDGRRVVLIRNDDEAGDGVAIPNTNLIHIENSGGRIGLNSKPFLYGSDETKDPEWSFADLIVLPPGTSVAFELPQALHGTLVIEAKDNYMREVQQFTARSGVHLWTGRIELQLP